MIGDNNLFYGLCECLPTKTSNGCIRPFRYNHHRFLSKNVDESLCEYDKVEDVDREEYLRNLAAEALVKTIPFQQMCHIVLMRDHQHYRLERNSAMSDDAKNSMEATTPEKALKKILRKIDCDKDRKRLSDLILGTTVWIRRHLYVLKYQQSNPENTVAIARCLIDAHALFLERNDIDDRDHITLPEHTPTESFSIQYSFPLFLAEIVISQYGLDKSIHIARVMNKPGKITIRRNDHIIQDDDKFVREIWSLDQMVCKKVSNLDGCFQLEFDKSVKSIWGSQAWRNGLL